MEAVMPAEYSFIDEWDVDAPIDTVFGALADARTYPEWWRPVYLEVDADGPPAVGCASRQRFKGRLPYTLTQTSTITACDASAIVGGRGRRRPHWSRPLDAQ
jgi:hypothetical protein